MCTNLFLPMLFNAAFFILMLVISYLFTRPPVFHFALGFIFFSIVILGGLVARGVLSGVLPLVFVMVYIGAIMVMVGYVCSVTPNIKSASKKLGVLSLQAQVFFIIVLAIGGVRLVKLAPKDGLIRPSSGDFYYRLIGVPLFSYLCLVLLVLLVLSSLSISSVKSPLRRTNTRL